jgi:hypothetical protein
LRTNKIILDVDISAESATDYVAKDEALCLSLFHLKIGIGKDLFYALIMRKERTKLTRIGVAYELDKAWAKQEQSTWLRLRLSSGDFGRQRFDKRDLFLRCNTCTEIMEAI